MSTVELLGVPISRLGFDAALAECARLVREGQGGAVYFVNAHTLTEAGENEALRAAFLEATLCLADGMPLVWLSRLYREDIHSRVYGPYLMDAFLKQHRGQAHGFLGGAPGLAEKLLRQYGVRGVALSPPMRGFSPQAVREDWEAFLAKAPGGLPPALVWIGLGAPKQELWIHEARRLAPKTLFLGVGAAFDFLTGAKQHAPPWMQEAGLAWAFRLASEPRRLFRRYATSNTAFVLRAAREALTRSR